MLALLRLDAKLDFRDLGFRQLGLNAFDDLAFLEVQFLQRHRIVDENLQRARSEPADDDGFRNRRADDVAYDRVQLLIRCYLAVATPSHQLVDNRAHLLDAWSIVRIFGLFAAFFHV